MITRDSTFIEFPLSFTVEKSVDGRYRKSWCNCVDIHKHQDFLFLVHQGRPLLYYYCFLHVAGLNNTSNGNISNRPANISNISTYFEKSE